MYAIEDDPCPECDGTFCMQLVGSEECSDEWQCALCGHVLTVEVTVPVPATV